MILKTVISRKKTVKKWQRLSSFKNKNILFRPYLYFITTNNIEMQISVVKKPLSSVKSFVLGLKKTLTKNLKMRII